MGNKTALVGQLDQPRRAGAVMTAKMTAKRWLLQPGRAKV
jgi:hypothetical protein